MAEEQGKKAPEAEKAPFERQRPIDSGDVPQEKHTEAAPLLPIVPGCR